MKFSRLTLVFLGISLVLTACGKGQPEITPLPTQEIVANTATLAPTPTATEVPPLVFNICMAEEPAGLYRYDGYEGQSKGSVFAAIYTDLLAKHPTTDQSLFFENLPSEENGGIRMDSVPVNVGQPVLDASGKVVYLADGTRIEHAINFSIENPVVWSFEQDYFMNQFTVTYKLLGGLKWSDGEALVAEDFVFSYHLAERSGIGHYQWALDRTDSMIAVDEQTLVWTGIPGFVPRNLSEILWQPLPSHQLAELSSTELLTAEISSQLPLGWGAYRLVRWDPGTLILEKNPHFVLSGEGYPAYDRLVFQSEPELDAALQKLESGQCDVLDKTYQLEALEKEQLESLATENRLVTEDWEPVQQLVFGIRPAQYDDGMYHSWTFDRQDILGSRETRQALAACLDPETLLQDYLATRLPQTIPYSTGTVDPVTVDPSQALEELGWILDEESQLGVRIAQNVNNILNGTELRLSLLMGQSRLDQNIAQMIANRLAACGVAIDVQSLPVADLYLPGPEGPLFGRNFELALVTWKQEHTNTCQLYTKDQIPASINSWVGTNLAGLSDPGFDEACWQASTRLPAAETINDAALMAEFVPAIPLMPQYRLWVYSDRLSLPENRVFSDLWLMGPEQ